MFSVIYIVEVVGYLYDNIAPQAHTIQEIQTFHQQFENWKEIMLYNNNKGFFATLCFLLD